MMSLAPHCCGRSGRISRSAGFFEVPDGFDGLAFDIGGGPFDHHGPDRQCRENGLPYAAFGLLWREFGEGLVGAEQAKWIDEHFIQPLDKDDNFGTGDSLADAIGGFNPVWDSTADADARFWQAEAFAAQILKNRLEGARAVNRAGAVVDKALSRMKDGIVVLPRFAPWKNRLRQSEAKLVVYPSQRGGFNAQGVPIPDDPQHRLRCSFPERWRGLRAPQLERVFRNPWAALLPCQRIFGEHQHPRRRTQCLPRRTRRSR